MSVPSFLGLDFLSSRLEIFFAELKTSRLFTHASPASPMFVDEELAPVVEAIIWTSHLLAKLDCRVEQHWIPGHNHFIWPHNFVDLLSRDMYSGRTDACAIGDGGRDWIFDGAVEWEESIVSQLDCVLSEGGRR